MQARVSLVVVVLLTLISAPWIGALGPFEDSEVKIQSESYPELNEAQIDAIFNSGAKGVTSWVKQGTANPNAQNGPGDVNSVWISDVVNSTNNAVIIAGSYRGDVVFDNGPSPTERDQRTAFLAQLDQYGGWSWFVETGQPSDSVGSAHIEQASVGPSGIWVCGWITDTITFGNHSVTTGGLYTDGFAALYNVSISDWDVVSTWGGPYNDLANGCAATGEGSAYVVGSFRSLAQFGPNQHQSEGGTDMYVLKVDQMGGLSWVQTWGGEYNDNLTAIALDDIENAYIVGYYQDNVLDWPNNHIVSAGRPYNGFVSKVNPAGTFAWSRDIQGGVNGQPVFATAVTFGNGDVYVGGDFSGSADFRNGNSATLSMLANTSATNGFVASIGTNGNWVWATRSSGAQGSEQYVYDLAVGPLGTIAVSGAFLDNNQFWTNATFGSFLLSRAPGVEGFVAGLDAYGNWVWADGFGGEKDDIAYSVSWLGLGKILTGGRHCVDLAGGCGSGFGGILKTTYSEAEGAGFVWVFEVDTDYDTVPDLDDNCPTVNNTNQADMDGDSIGDLCDTDADQDNLDDYWDDCIGPTVNWNQSVWMNDRDRDGCKDDTEDNDDDGDGIFDGMDDCDDYSTKHNWSSGLANDYDSDGCHDSDEDIDDDSDGILDEFDTCPRYPYNRTWTSSLQNDHDGDGCDNNDDDADDDNDGINDVDEEGDELDRCPRGETGWTSDSTVDQDGDGCLDSSEDLDDDGDGILDFTDDCLTGALDWNSQTETDRDGDGCRDFDEDDDDDSDGLLDANDSCPSGDVGWTSDSTTDVDGDGCRDAGEDTDDDGDKVPDVGDSCPSGVTGWESTPLLDADGDGCRDSDEDPDDDNDGFNDGSDLCPGTPQGVTVYEGGCSAEQGDNDEDGIRNDLDLCPEVAAVEGFDLNFDGCTDDIDGDGITDNLDQCPDTPTGEQIDDFGCGYLTQQDSDEDGVIDINDACLGTSNQSIRDANPGYSFDNIFGCWTGDGDDDEDGYDNWLDICPDSNPEELIFEGGCNFEQQDEDSDGIPNGDDGCPYTTPGATVNDNGCSVSQLASVGDDSSSGALVAIFAVVILLIVGGAVGAVLVIKRRQATERDARRALKRGDMPAPATEVAEQTVAEEDDYNYEDDPNYKVDENGCEWWLDDDRKWWFRTPEMDDWAEHTGEQ